MTSLRQNSGLNNSQNCHKPRKSSPIRKRFHSGFVKTIILLYSFMQRSVFSGPLLFTNGANGTPQNCMRSIPSNSNLPSLQQRPMVTSSNEHPSTSALCLHSFIFCKLQQRTPIHHPARCACTVLFCAWLACACTGLANGGSCAQVAEDFSAQLCMQKKRAHTASNSTTTQQQNNNERIPANPPAYLPLRRRHLLLLAAFLLVRRRPRHADLPRPLH